MKSLNAFLQVLNSAEQNIKHMASDAKIVRQLTDSGRMDEAYAVSLRLAKYAERGACICSFETTDLASSLVISASMSEIF